MITYIKMKIKEHRIKLALYYSIEIFMDEKEGFVETIKNLYFAIKDTPINELKDQFIRELANVVHEKTQEEQEEWNDDNAKIK